MSDTVILLIEISYPLNITDSSMEKIIVKRIFTKKFDQLEKWICYLTITITSLLKHTIDSLKIRFQNRQLGVSIEPYGT